MELHPEHLHTYIRGLDVAEYSWAMFFVYLHPQIYIRSEKPIGRGVILNGVLPSLRVRDTSACLKPGVVPREARLQIRTGRPRRAEEGEAR